MVVLCVVFAEESVLFAATKYALHRQQAAAAELLFAAGARATKPNVLGVSPLLLLLRWASAAGVAAALGNRGFAALLQLYNVQLPRLWTKQVSSDDAGGRMFRWGCGDGSWHIGALECCAITCPSC